MSHHDATVVLRQMLVYSREAIAMVHHRERGDLDTDLVLSRALVHTLEMIGEAARRVPAEGRAEHPAIPWQEVIALRNRLIHGYDQVDLDVVWGIVTPDLPQLAAELERIVAGL